MPNPGGSRRCRRELLTSLGLLYGHRLEEEGGGGGRPKGVWPMVSTADATTAATQEEKATAVADAPDVGLALREELVAPARTAGKVANSFLVDVADQNYYEMIDGPTLVKWTCLNFSCMHPEEVLRFCVDLIHMCNASGMDFDPNPFIEVKTASPDHIEDAFRDVHRRISKYLGKQMTGNQLQLLTIVLLPDDSGFYGNIQRAPETSFGNVFQYCLPKHARKLNKSYLKNVVLEIKAKVGNRNEELQHAIVCNGTQFVSKVPPREGRVPSSDVVPSMNLPDNTMYGSLVLAKLCIQEMPAISEEACEIVVDQKICSANEFDSVLCGYDGFQKRINGSGAAISNKTSPTCHTKKENIQLEVMLSDRSTVVTVNENDTARFVGYSALETFGAQHADCYLRIGNHVINSESTFVDACLLSLELRARGGSSGGGSTSTSTGSKLNIADYIRRVKKKVDQRWFEKVTLPTRLQKSKEPVIEYTVNLGDDGAVTLSKLLRCFEKKHKTGWCFSALLDVRHIYYSEIDDEFEVEGVTLCRMTQTSYDDNLKVILKVIRTHFMYQDAKQVWQYPLYVDDLERQIKDIGQKRASCYCNKERSLIYNHLATWSPAHVSGLFALVIMTANNLHGQDHVDFTDAIENGVAHRSLDWQKEAHGPEAPLGMREVYNYELWDPVQGKWVLQKTYKPTLYSWTDFGRCMLTHATKYGVTLKQILSSLWIMKPGHTSLLQRQITFYKGKGKANVAFTTNASGIPIRNAMAGHQIVGLPKSPDDSESAMKLV